MKNNTKNLVTILVGVILLSIGWLLYLSRSTDNLLSNDNSSAQNSLDTGTKTSTTVKRGTYQTYTAARLAQAGSNKVVLFFRANWAASDAALDANIQANKSSIPVGITILDVNYDLNETLKQKYAVSNHNTLVEVDSKGNQIYKWNGSVTLKDLLAAVR